MSLPGTQIIEEVEMRKPRASPQGGYSYPAIVIGVYFTK